MYHCTLATIYITADCILSWPPVTKCGIDYHTEYPTCTPRNMSSQHRASNKGASDWLTQTMAPEHLCAITHRPSDEYITGGILLFFGLHTLLLCCLCISLQSLHRQILGRHANISCIPKLNTWPLRNTQNAHANTWALTMCKNDTHKPPCDQYVSLHYFHNC